MLQLDHLYERMEDDLEKEVVFKEDSVISKFYAGKTLFITGVTGYMGICLVEKLLRSCPDIKRIYVLMRKKKDRSISETSKTYFSHLIFDRLRLNEPNFEERVTVMEGDLAVESLGLSQEDQNTIKENVEIMIHNGANVKFDIRVSLSLKVNVMGTKYMLDLAKACKKLEVFVYVSTAYSHCYKKVIEEKFYPSPADLESVERIIKADLDSENGLSEENLKNLLKEHPNIYTYSKAVSEDLVNQCGQKHNFACCVFRPSVVLSTYKEPIAGWCANMNGPVIVIIGAGLGVIHINYHLGYPQDFIPCDLTINALIAITWDCREKWEVEKKPLVYNYGSSTENPTSLEKFYNAIKGYGSTDMCTSAVWMYFFFFVQSKFLFWVGNILFHLIPAVIADAVLLISGRKARAIRLWLRINKHIDMFDYFGNGNWRIHIPETLKVINRLNTTDRETFFCDIREVDWEDFIFILWSGLRKYLLKEQIDSKASYRKYVQLSIAHYGLITLIFLVVFYLIIGIFYC